MIYYVGDNLTLTVPNPVDVDFLNAYISRDGDETWTKLNASPLATTHSKVGSQEVYQSYTYVWPIVGDESATCRIQIRNAENEDVIAQSAVFEIQERVLTSIVLFPAFSASKDRRSEGIYRRLFRSNRNSSGHSARGYIYNRFGVWVDNSTRSLYWVKRQENLR